MRAKVKKRKVYTIIVTQDIPLTFESSHECRAAGEACRKSIEQELGKQALKYTRIIVDWYARKATAKIRVIDCKGN